MVRRRLPPAQAFDAMKPCSVCAHPNAEAINRALLAGQTTFRELAHQYGVGKSSLHRHDRTCVAVIPTVEVPDDRVALVVDRMERIVADAEKVWREQVKPGATPSQMATFLNAMRQALMDLARLRREYDDRPQVNILVLPEWQKVRTTMLDALSPYPDARLAVARALAALEAPGGSR